MSVPSLQANINARTFRVTLKETPLGQDDRRNTIKQLLKSGKPLPFGISVDSQFLTGSFDKKGNKPVWSTYRDSKREGHAMLIVGFNDSIGAYEVMNSFGPKWGDNGFVWIDYSHLENPDTVIYDYDFFPEAVTTTSNGLGGPSGRNQQEEGRFGASQIQGEDDVPNGAIFNNEVLYCRLVKTSQNGDFLQQTLAFDISEDAIKRGEIQPGVILTRNTSIKSLPLRLKDEDKSQVGRLLPGDKLQVSALVSYTLATGEIQYWVGGKVIAKRSS